jgi:predicted acetyltransferase
MKIEIKLADNTNGFIIKNMYPLYLHDISGIHGILPNEYGIFEEEPIRTLAEQYDIQQAWFENPNLLYPYLIMVDNIPAGFCLVGSGKYVPQDVDYYIYETFLLSTFRGKDISYQALIEIFQKHHGKWMLFTHSTENNNRAKAFWHKTIRSYTDYEYTTEEKFIDGMPKLVFRFDD